VLAGEHSQKSVDEIPLLSPGTLLSIVRLPRPPDERRMFIPPKCPKVDCPNHVPPFPDFFKRHGRYRPKCRSHPVERFRCKECEGTFSRQTFRADYRQRKPHINTAFFHLMVNCVGQRQAATVLGVARRTVERRFVWLGRHCRGFHEAHMKRAVLKGPFQLDEFESFESNRYQPLTIPVLIDRKTYFIVGSAVAPIRRKGQMTKLQLQRRAEHEAKHGRRPTESAKAVRSVLEKLLPVVPGPVVIDSDHKPSYQWIGRRLFGERFFGIRHDAKRRRDKANPLFPINHTNARVRHFLSRLRRRSWCVSKKGARLACHLDIATVWVNYARGITNRTKTTPAEALRVVPKRYRIEEILSWQQDTGDFEAA
jgi:transposase-like protein